MARIVGYIGASLDGFIASPDGSLDWLTKYETVNASEFAFERFIERIDTVVMGRGTYDFLDRERVAWPHADKRGIIVTSRPIENLPAGAEIWSSGIDSLIAHLRRPEAGTVWLVGGGQLQMAFIERKALDEIEVYVVPELIGGGVPLFPSSGFAASPKLLSAQVVPPGITRMHYCFD
jgi:dihydrofolate reductase